ncbi:MAG: cytochrome c peroxidase, partial [Gammaproteobacteria bacterium]
FYDRRLSHNNTFSCAMCHIPEQGFGSNELATAVGIEGRTVRRNAPTLYNIAYAKSLFHDARENSLEQQIWGPLLAHNEMANPSVGRVIEKIKSIPEYSEQFEKAFEGQAPDMKNLGEAIASYERTLVSANSNFDRWFYAKEKKAMNAEATAGYYLFIGKGHCASCHTIEKKHALFTDDKLHNTGIGFARSMQKDPPTRKVLVAPGTWLSIDNNVVADSSEPKPNDLGYYEISGNPDDRWKYRTPTLRNISLTSPYMHDGSLSSLKEVVAFYNGGGISNELLDPAIQPLNLSQIEMEQLLAFLNNLTGDNVDIIISDAFAAPVGNTK